MEQTNCLTFWGDCEGVWGSGAEFRRVMLAAHCITCPAGPERPPVRAAVLAGCATCYPDWFVRIDIRQSSNIYCAVNLVDPRRASRRCRRRARGRCPTPRTELRPCGFDPWRLRPLLRSWPARCACLSWLRWRWVGWSCCFLLAVSWAWSADVAWSTSWSGQAGLKLIVNASTFLFRRKIPKVILCLA